MTGLVKFVNRYNQSQRDLIMKTFISFSWHFLPKDVSRRKVYPPPFGPDDQFPYNFEVGTSSDALTDSQSQLSIKPLADNFTGDSYLQEATASIVSKAIRRSSWGEHVSQTLTWTALFIVLYQSHVYVYPERERKGIFGNILDVPIVGLFVQFPQICMSVSKDHGHG